MIILVLAFQFASTPIVERRVDAELPPIAVETQGLVREDGRLTVETTDLFGDEGNDAWLAGSDEPLSETFARLTVDLEEEIAESREVAAPPAEAESARPRQD